MFKRIVFSALAMVTLVGCAEERANRSYVQELSLRKDAFQGEWYYAVTAVESSYDASWVFPGQQDMTTHKIRWKIEKDYLYAYRTHAITRGADRDLHFREDDNVGEPVAAFAIEKHFDIRHRYNSVSGEEYNVIEENTSDRLWYEREYMRVDWSSNRINNFSYVYGDLFSAFGYPAPGVEPVSFFVEDPNHPYAPKFYDDNGDGEFEYVDVVHQVTLTPTVYDVSYMEQLAPAQMTIRNSFMRVKDDDYEPLHFPDAMFEEFGYFRNERGTYDIHRGQTDFLDYYVNRFNIWEASHVDTECVAHDQCGEGSSCDLYHHKCTIPYDERQEKPIVYTKTVNFPERYEAQTVRIENGWNAAFQATVNTLKYGGARLVACVDDDSPAASAGECCTAAQRAAGDASCVPDMFIIADNSCTKAGVQAYLDGHGDIAAEVEPYLSDGEITDANLVKVCAATEAASARAGGSEPFRWEQLGDLRYSFISLVPTPSSASPLGYGPANVDSETGQIINGNANVYMAALNSYEGYIRDLYDLVDGYVDDERFSNGEHVREYFQNVGHATGPPTAPQVFAPRPEQLDRAKIDEVREGLMERLADVELLDRQRNFGSNMKRLANSYIEDMVLNDEYLIAHGVATDSALDEEMKNHISPFRQDIRDLHRDEEKLAQVLAKHNVFPLEAYADASVESLIWAARRKHGLEQCQGAHQDAVDVDGDGRLSADEQTALDEAVRDYRSKPECRTWAIDWIMGRVYRGVMEHEIGHTLGLRHNFEGSFDEEGYPSSYWDLKEEIPDIRWETYDADGNGTLSDGEYLDYTEAAASVERDQEVAGRDQLMYSSIMDYGGNFYSDFDGLGKYDLGAIKFGYGQIREVYDGDPNARRDNRYDVPYWMGGEICATHDDCPAHDAAVYASYQEGQPTGPGATTQTCGVRSDRGGQREEWNPIEQVGGKGFCSNWDEDMERGGTRGAFIVPGHLFCSDERVGDRASCSRWDEGSSSTQIVQNMINLYERQYIFNNFRRYRRSFGTGSYLGRIFSRYFTVIGKQFQAMVWRLFYMGGFASDDGPGGFDDMFRASVMGMNFFANVLSRPSIGPYRWDDERELLVRCGRSDLVGECSNQTVSQFDLTMGKGGKYLYSTYETGYYGAINRIAQIGTFMDKWLALEAMSTRYWSTAGGNDESIPMNYYDAFGDSMLDVFSGVVTERYDRFAPVAVRDDDGFVERIQYRDYWYGTFFGGDVMSAEERQRRAGPGASEDDPRERYVGADLVDPGISVIHRIYGLMYSLAFFSSYFDATYADYVQLKQYDATWDPIEDLDSPLEVIEYRSPLRGKIFRAVQTDDSRSVAADLVGEAEEARRRYEDSKLTGSEFDQRRKRGELENAESFLNIAADMIERMGIAY